MASAWDVIRSRWSFASENGCHSAFTAQALAARRHVDDSTSLPREHDVRGLDNLNEVGPEHDVVEATRVVPQRPPPPKPAPRIAALGAKLRANRGVRQASFKLQTVDA